MNLIIPVSFMIDNKTFLTKQFHEKDIRRVGLEWADKGTLSFLSQDQFRNLIQSGKIRPGKRSAQSSGFRFNQGSVNKEETTPMENLSQAQKIIETAQIALGNAGVISEKQTPERKALLAKRIADLKQAMSKTPNGKTKFDLAHWQETDKDEKADKINTFDTRGKIVKEAALAEVVSAIVSFNLDGKPLMVLSVPDAKAAIKNWVERGALPRQAMSANYYLVPFLIRGEPAQGKLYKKGQRRDAKQVTKSESRNTQGVSITEGKDYFAVEGTVDGQAAGAQTAPTSQEAEHYAEAMLAYLKKQSPKAKKITVHIFKVVNYQRKGTPLKVLKAESTETQGDTIAEGKAVKIGKLTFESFTNGSISGWWVKHITVVHGQGVWKTNTLGWIEERKSSKTSLVPSFLWLEKGNGEENIKALVIWPKGHATGFPNKDVGGASITRATTDGTSGMLQATAKWIQERRPDLVKEETAEPKLTEAEKLMDAAQIALGRAGVVTEEKQAPKITEKMIRDDMGLGQSDIGKGALMVLRSGWCANCDKEWYAVVFLAKNRVWWAEINGLDRHPTYKNMGKRNLHNAALAKFDAPGKWKDDAGRKYVPVTDSVSHVTEKFDLPKFEHDLSVADQWLFRVLVGRSNAWRGKYTAKDIPQKTKEVEADFAKAKNQSGKPLLTDTNKLKTWAAALVAFQVSESVLNLKKKIRPDTHHLTTEGAGEATPITAATIRDDLGYGRIQFMRAGWCANCDKAWYAAVFMVDSKKTYWAEISAGDKHPTYTDFGGRMGSKALEKFDAPGKWKNTVPALKSPFNKKENYVQ